MRKVTPSAALAAVLLLLLGLAPAAQDAPATPSSDAEIERFLLKAKVVKTRGTSKGITGSLRATLSDGTVTHEAQIQAIDEYRTRFDGPAGPELSFRDTWSYNVAAYKLDRLLGLDMVPVSVERRYGDRPAAFTWWIDDVMMDEEERFKKNLAVPSIEQWNRQMSLLRVFDQLIGNTDRNLGNLLISKDWKIWAIDHTRAFRLNPSPKTPGNVTRCDRVVLDRMKALDRDTLRKHIGRYMYGNEIGALLKRRDAIVKILEQAGPAVLFDR